MSNTPKAHELTRFEYEVEGDALLRCALSYIEKRATHSTVPTGWWLAVDNGVLKITIKGEANGNS